MKPAFFKNILNCKSFQWNARRRQKPKVIKIANPTLSSQLNIANPSAPPPSLEDLRKAVERSTSANRTYFISFLVILIYLLVIVASTTDYQLLIPNSLVRLPFVDTNVSLFMFYIASPLIVLVAHFNLLQNLESHHNKLCTWRDSYSGYAVPRALIEPFLYDFAVLEEQGQLTKSVRFFARALFLYLSPVALLAFLWRFSDYQNLWISTWHFLVLIVDVFIIGYFQRAVQAHRLLPGTVWGLILLAAIQTGFVSYVTLTNGTLLWDAGLRFTNFIDDNFIDDFETKNVVSKYTIKHYFPSPIKSLLLPRISIDPYVSLTLDDKLLRVQMAFDGETDFPKWLTEKGKGLDLRNRSLKGAELNEADLRRAWLNNSKLNGASLKNAKLDAAILDKASMQGADLTGAQLQGAYLTGAQLQGADLSVASLQGAHLFDAKLQSAHLFDAKLQGADLTGAQLQGADLSGAQLQSANLSRAQLQSANLTGVQLQGAHFFRAQLQGANLADAQLQGANLFDAQLQGANLFDAQLQGADLSGAQLQGAHLFRAQLQGANLTGVQLQGANLSDASLQGAIMAGSQLLGVVITNDKPVKHQAGNIDFLANAYWEGIKKLSKENVYQERIAEAIKRVNHFQSPEKLFVQEADALAEALPEICRGGFEALIGSLMLGTEEAVTLAWKKLPEVTECNMHLAKISEWAQAYMPQLFKSPKIREAPETQ